MWPLEVKEWRYECRQYMQLVNQFTLLGRHSEYYGKRIFDLLHLLNQVILFWNWYLMSSKSGATRSRMQLPVMIFLFIALPIMWNTGVPMKRNHMRQRRCSSWTKNYANIEYGISKQCPIQCKKKVFFYRTQKGPVNLKHFQMTWDMKRNGKKFYEIHNFLPVDTTTQPLLWNLFKFRRNLKRFYSKRTEP